MGYVNQFAEFNHYVNSPVANYKGEMYNLPFNMNTFSKMWNIRTPKEAQDIITKQRSAITSEPKNLEEQAISLVGTDIYEKLKMHFPSNKAADIRQQALPLRPSHLSKQAYRQTDKVLIRYPYLHPVQQNFS